MNAGIRISSGIALRRREITRLEKIRTKVTARPMPIPLLAAVVIASVGHMPSTIRNVGFSSMMPFMKIFPYFFIYCTSLAACLSASLIALLVSVTPAFTSICAVAMS